MLPGIQTQVKTRINCSTCGEVLIELGKGQLRKGHFRLRAVSMECRFNGEKTSTWFTCKCGLKSSLAPKVLDYKLSDLDTRLFGGLSNA